MKRLIPVLFLIFAFLLGANRHLFKRIQAQSVAPSQSPAMCYSQCGFYKFYWKGDFCYDLVMQNCTESFDLKDVISLIKSIRSSFLSGKLKEIADVSTVFKAWLICKPLIEECIVPQLDACAQFCQTNTVGYAPNLTVGSDWSGFHGLYYDDEKDELALRVMNTGLGYAWDIGVTLTYGYTDKQDGSGMTGGTYLSETIPELLFFGSRQAAPKGIGDIVTDFLIDESNFASYLQRFKSDANNHYIPPGWEKTITIGAPEGKLTRFILNVDPNQDITEANERDNTYILDIDKRPKPATYEITSIEAIRQGDSLTDYQVRVTVKNQGDLDGNAALSFFEGSDAFGSPIYSSSKTVTGHGETVYETMMQVDVTDGSWTCSTNKRFTATVTDENGTSDRSQFEIPLYAGFVSGRVIDTKGKPVAGATVTSSTGLATTSGNSGFYHLSGFSKLGEVNLTFSHPNYTGKVVKTVNFTFNKSSVAMGSCNIEGLNITSVDAVLRDTPLKLTIRLKDRSGNLLTGKTIFTGGAGSVNYEVTGETVIQEMEPGQFRVTAFSSDFVTKEVQTVLTPPEQVLEISLEKLNGRPDDNGLSIIKPDKLWDKTIATGKIDTLGGSKNGKLLVVNTNDSANKQGGKESWFGNLTFLNPIDGTTVNSLVVPFNVGQQHVALDISYDGRTVGFMYNVNDSENKTKNHAYVKVFNAWGNELGTMDIGVSRAVMMEVAPDGYYLYPHQLINSNLYKFTRKEIEGVGDGRDFQSYMANQTLHFLRNNLLVTGCKEGQCLTTLDDKTNRVLADIDGVSRAIDSDTTGSKIIIRTNDKLYYFGGNTWHKDVPGNPHFYSAALSPGGEYAIVETGGSGRQTLRIYHQAGTDVTPEFNYQNVRLVEANDRGLFFSEVQSNKLSYYQIGKYETEYNPPEEANEETIKTSDLEQYSGGEFKPLAFSKSWDELDLYGGLLRAKEKLILKTAWGTLTVGEGTIFAKNSSGQPLLFWGQFEIDATTPQTVLVFKFKEYDVSKFNFILNLYKGGDPLTGAFVAVTNLHTRYEVKSGPGEVAVLVFQGSVEVDENGKKTEVKTGQKATVRDREVKVGRNWQYLLVRTIPAVIILAVGFLLYKVRHHPAFQRFLVLLKKIIRIKKKK